MGVIASSPNWQVPMHIRAWQTYRTGGVSRAPYDSLNLALHVEDVPECVLENRKIVQKALNLPQKPTFLDQRHTNQVIKIFENEKKGETPVADASWTDHMNTVLAVMTADCLPILMTNKTGTLVAAIHAGWRGLENGIIAQTLQALPEVPENLLVWIGPGISKAYFEVGEDVRDQMLCGAQATPEHFEASRQGRWLMDLQGIARWQLQRLGVERIWAAEVCTYAQSAHFFSYRRAGQTGRMATFIWMEETR